MTSQIKHECGIAEQEYLQYSPRSGKGKEHSLFLGESVTNDWYQSCKGKQGVIQPVGSGRKVATPSIELILHRWVDEQAVKQAPEDPEENCGKHALAVSGAFL